MAIGGITAYEKLLKIKNQTRYLTKEGNYDYIFFSNNKRNKGGG
jgi:hypothetical protein